MPDNPGTDRRGLRDLISANPQSEHIASYYDAWAEQYDRDLVAWDYQAPAVAANLIKSNAARDGYVLDAGCGTGLTGRALQVAGFQHLIGMDLSVRLARSGRSIRGV